MAASMPGEGTVHSSIVRAFRTAGGAMAATTLLGVVTGKIVAVVAGAEGVGLLGLYRMLGQLAVLILSLETGTLIVQRVSACATAEAARLVFHSAWRLFWIQAVTVLIVALLGSSVIARALFGPSDYWGHVTEVRLVLSMVTGILSLRLVTALLDGRLLIRQSTASNVLTSVATLLAVYPLLSLGRAGIALVLGSTCFVGAAYGASHVWREYQMTGADLRIRWEPSSLLSSMPASPILTLRAVTNAGALLVLQTLLSRFYGLKPLGWFNAAALVESSFVLIMMSSMKSYFLPSLGRLHEDTAKAELVNRLLSFLLIVLLPCVVALLALAPYILLAAFSAEFMGAVGILTLLILSLPAQVVSWYYSIFLLHKLNYRVPLSLELLRAVLLLSSVFWCGSQHKSILLAVGAYTASHWVTALLYVISVSKLYGRRFISRGNSILILGLIIWSLVSCLVFCPGIWVTRAGNMGSWPVPTWQTETAQQGASSRSVWLCGLLSCVTLAIFFYLARRWYRKESL